MMAWLELGFSIALVGATVFLPGLVVGLVAGIRGIWLWGLAAPASVSVVALASLTTPLLGIQWGIAPILGMTVLVALAVGVLRASVWKKKLLPEDAALKSERWISLIAWVIPAVIIVLQLVVLVRSPSSFSQSFDNIFHLNAIQYVVQNGNASPFFVSTLTTGAEGGGFYPTAWHALASLPVSMFMTDVAVASNAVMFVFAALVWPISALLLARVLGGGKPIFLVTAGVLSASIGAFPLLLLDYGVLYPNMMALALVPPALALIIRLLDVPGGWQRRVGLAILLLGVVPGIAVSHTGALMVLIAVGWAPLGVWFFAAYRRAASRRVRVGLLCALAGALAATVAVWCFVRPAVEARGWPVEVTVAQAVGEVLLAAPFGAPVNLVVAALVAVGVATAVRRRQRSDLIMLAMLVIVASLYIVVSGVPYLAFRDFITGPWYNNAPRLAAILPIAWIPLGAVGATRLVEQMSNRLQKIPRPVPAKIVSVGIVAILLLLPQVGILREVQRASGVYAMSEDAALLSADEYQLIERLPSTTPSDAVIVGNPWTGTALAYAFASRQVLLPHTLVALSEADELILEELRDATAESPVCSAVKDEKVSFVLDFGAEELYGGEHEYPGLEELSTSNAVELVDSEGAARLYRITACG